MHIRWVVYDTDIIECTDNTGTKYNPSGYNCKPSPGYAGVSLRLAKTELNAHGLHRTDGLRLNPIILFTFLLVGLK